VALPNRIKIRVRATSLFPMNESPVLGPTSGVT
jgi:hypothetical protein